MAGIGASTVPPYFAIHTMRSAMNPDSKISSKHGLISSSINSNRLKLFAIELNSAIAEQARTPADTG